MSGAGALRKRRLDQPAFNRDRLKAEKLIDSKVLEQLIRVQAELSRRRSRARASCVQPDAGVRMLVCMHVGQGGVSLHVQMTPLFGFMLHGGCRPGVKQTLRLDESANRLPGFASWIFLNRDLTKRRLTE